jgi:hypothetical protein
MQHDLLQNSWYYSFFHMLTEGVRTGDLPRVLENVAFVSFNYDRCLQEFLVRAFQVNYGVSLSQAIEIVEKLRIIHPYGSIGSPFSGGLSFGGKFSGSTLLSVSRQLRTYSEQMIGNELIDSIFELLLWANKVVFLGCAFHKQNISLFRELGQASKKKVFATVKGLSKPNQSEIIYDLLSLIDPQAKQFYRRPIDNLRDFDIGQYNYIMGSIMTGELTSREFLDQYERALL